MNRPLPIVRCPSSSPNGLSSIAHCLSPRPSSGFTLVELLVVIGIIALLAAILLPAMNAAFTKAEKSQAQVEVRSIAAAIQAYNNEYGKMPALANNQHGVSDITYETDKSQQVIEILQAVNTNLNPRKIAFLDAPQGSSTNFVDPWSEGGDGQYVIVLDNNYDNQVSYKTKSTRGVTIVYSAGPKRSDPEDDIYSF